MKTFRTVIALSLLLAVATGCKLLGGSDQSDSSSGPPGTSTSNAGAPSPNSNNPLSAYRSSNPNSGTAAPLSSEELSLLFPSQIGNFTREAEPVNESGPKPSGAVYALSATYKAPGLSESVRFFYYKFSPAGQARYYLDLKVKDETSPDTSVPVSMDVPRFRLVRRTPTNDGEMVYLQSLPKYPKGEKIWIRKGDTLRTVFCSDQGHAEGFANAYLGM